MASTLFHDQLAPLSVGVEEEFQILQPETLMLAPAFDALAACHPTDDLEIKSELHQSCCEVVTPPCQSVEELASALRANRRRLIDVAKRAGYRVALAGTHPSSLWYDLPITREERRLQSEFLFQEAHRQCLAFALHVHVGIPDRTTGLRVMNDARELLPILYALSCSSPFLEGRCTGLKSSRLLRAFGFPRTGIPDVFEDLEQLDRMVSILQKASLVRDQGQLWWDIRLHHKFPTVEFRICDAVPRIRDVTAIAALIQVFVAELLIGYENGNESQPLDRTLLEENRWRAARFGTEVELLNRVADRYVVEPLKTILSRRYESLEPIGQQLCVLEHLNRAMEIAEQGSSADRQLAIWNGNPQFTDTVALYLAETAAL